MNRINKNKINCIGFIMDGNRRWAKEQGLNTVEGHKAGLDKVKEVIEWSNEAKISHLIFYAFSTENWKRSESEVSYLLDLFSVAAKDKNLVHKHSVRVRVIGDVTKFSQKIQTLIKKMEDDTKKYTAGTVTVALSYGGRAEILHAVNEIIESGVELPITEEKFREHLWTKDIPDPDIIVRTGEAMRLSNFLTWQSVYSELYFTSTYWPDFDKEEFEYVLQEVSGRERRYGK